MITIRLNGGLGNQMFQYAMARALATKYNKKLMLDIDGFDTYKLRNFELNKYKIKADIFSRKLNKNLKVINPNSFYMRLVKKFKLMNFMPNYYIEKNRVYNCSIKVKDHLYLEGYFQNEKYFYFIRNEILNEFTINRELSNYTKIAAKLIKNSQNSISIHIRRGDYISDSQTNNVHGTCSLEYYDKAINYMKSKIGDIIIFVFSDDVPWTKENLKYENVNFIEPDKNKIPHEDIYLMSLCNHNIIANSSFSWWGAWLNKNDDKIVVTPKRWFTDDNVQEQSKDIVCKSWVKI